jgi:hypothetical protein
MIPGTSLAHIFRVLMISLLTWVAPMPVLPVRLFLHLGTVLLVASWCGAGFSQKLVDPKSVAPEFREAAEKRRAEQIKLIECSKKADHAKVLPRDRTAFVSGCLEE